LLALLAMSAAGGVITGVYEACWSLLLHLRGATELQVGISWTLFALPFALTSPITGWMADHYDRRVLVLIGLAVAALFALIYPQLRSVPVLLTLGVVESLGVAVELPAAQSLLGQIAPKDSVGQAQGLFASTQTAATAVSTALAGALYGISPVTAFGTSAGLALALALPTVLWWRHLPGRVRQSTEPDLALTEVTG
jgi:DHA1 family multidrug resistance protein-like MFS transporter